MNSSTKQRRPHFTAEERESWISRFRSSGLAQAHFAEQNNLKLKTLQRWLYGHAAQPATKQAQSCFLTLRLLSLGDVEIAPPLSFWPLFFVMCNLLRRRDRLSDFDFEILARVLCARREARGFLLTAWVFLPDHWHAILGPRDPATISEAR